MTMRDSLNLSAYGAGYCIGGEPTGDETPLDDWSPAFPPAKPCRYCGTHTTCAAAVCIDCELSPEGRPAARIIPLHPMRCAA